MTKRDLVKLIAEEVEMTQKDVEVVIDAFLETSTSALVNGVDVNLSGFGKFVVTERAERKGRNPQTGEEMIIPAVNTVKFKPSSSLKEAVK